MAEQLKFEFNTPLPQLRQLWTPDDIYRAADQATVELFHEDRRIERKSGRIQAKDLAEYLSMWANTQPYGGIVFVGIEKDGSISGCKNLSQEQINKLDTLYRYCADARHESKRISVYNTAGHQDFIIAIRVHYNEHRLVETSSGDAFVREGDEKRSLSEPEKREIRINKGEIDYEMEPTNLSYPDDFDTKLIRTFVEAYVNKRQIRQRYTAEDVLRLAKLSVKRQINFTPNLACAILFAKDPRQVVPGCRVHLIRYDGKEEAFGSKLNSTFDRWIEGPLPYIISETERLIDAQIRSFTRLIDGRFLTNPEYPHEVWLEAIVNACVHRSYNLRHMPIFVKMFDDKFVVESPGGFLPPTTPDTVYDAHNPRNPYLMEAMYYLDFVKCRYEGTRRMRAEMIGANLPAPEFAQKQVGTLSVHVTLRNNVEHRKAFIDADVSSLIDENTYSALRDEERQIINCLAERGYLNVTEASLLVKRDWSTVKNYLTNLIDIGVVEAKSRNGKARDSAKRYVLRHRPTRSGSTK